MSYRHIHPVGQYDENSCWAASLEWFVRANNLGNITQEDVLGDYMIMRGAGGSLDLDGITQLIEDPRWCMQHFIYYSGAQLTSDRVRSLLASGPIYVGYYSQSLQSNHVNVIFDVSGHGSHTKVWAMEPHAIPIGGGDPGYDGRHKHRLLSAYTTREVHVGAVRGASSSGSGYDESYYY